MPDAIVQVVLRTADAIPSNFVTNQFCIQGMSNSDNNEAAITTAIKDFYDDFRSLVFPSDVATTGHMCKFYLAGGPAPNYPFSENSWDFAAAPSQSTLPREVAICLSFQGLRIPGTPQARRRGRIYIGPVGTSVQTAGRPTSATRTALLTAAQQLYTDIQTVDASYRWAVWSTRDGTAVPLHDAWVDDAFDTQRSRGNAPTTRTTLEFS